MTTYKLLLGGITMDIKMIEKIVQGIQIPKGELVLLHFWGEDKYLSTLCDFQKSVSALGAVPFSYQEPILNNPNFYDNLTDCISDSYYQIFEPFSIVIDIFMQQPPSPYPGKNSDAVTYYRDYFMKLFTALEGKKKFVQIRIPTIENAELSNLAYEDYMQRMNLAYDIDYTALLKECNDFVAVQKDKTKARITTQYNENTYVLDLDLSTRKWYIDAGDGDLPCGELYIAPIETFTCGDIYFPMIDSFDDTPIKDIVLHIENGKIQSSNSALFNEQLKELPKDALCIGELGIGMNPNVTSFCNYSLLDEKRKGSFHLGIGANDLFGGTNHSNVHMDFVGLGDLHFA